MSTIVNSVLIKQTVGGFLHSKEFYELCNIKLDKKHTWKLYQFRTKKHGCAYICVHCKKEYIEDITKVFL